MDHPTQLTFPVLQAAVADRTPTEEIARRAAEASANLTGIKATVSEFKALPKEERPAMLAPVMKAFQAHIGELTKRSKFAEASYADLLGLVQAHVEQGPPPQEPEHGGGLGADAAAQIAELQGRLDNVSAERAEIMAMLGDATGRCATLEQENAALNGEKNNMALMMAESDAMLQGLEERFAAAPVLEPSSPLVQKNQRLEDRLGTVSEESAALKEALDALVLENAGKAEALVAAASTVQQLEQALQQQGDAVRSVSASAGAATQELRSALDVAGDRVAELERKQAAAADEADVRRRESSGFQERVADLESQLQVASARASQLEEQGGGQAEQAAALRAQVEQKEAEAAQFEKTQQVLTAQLQELQASSGSAGDAAAALVADRDAEVSQLQRQVGELDAQNKAFGAQVQDQRSSQEALMLQQKEDAASRLGEARAAAEGAAAEALAAQTMLQQQLKQRTLEAEKAASGAEHWQAEVGRQSKHLEERQLELDAHRAREHEQLAEARKLEGHHDELAKQLAAKETELLSLGGSSEATARELQSLASAKAELEAEVATLSGAMEMLSELTLQKDAVAAQASAAEQRVGEVEAELASLGDAKEQVGALGATLAENERKEKIRNARYAKMVEKNDAEAQAAQAELASLRTELQELRSSHGAAGAKAESAASASATAAAELQAAEARVSELQLELSRMETGSMQREASLQEASAALAEASARSEQLSAHVEGAAATEEGLRENLSSLQQSLSRGNQERARMQATIAELADGAAKGGAAAAAEGQVADLAAAAAAQMQVQIDEQANAAAQLRRELEAEQRHHSLQKGHAASLQAQLKELLAQNAEQHRLPSALDADGGAGSSERDALLDLEGGMGVGTPSKNTTRSRVAAKGDVFSAFPEPAKQFLTTSGMGVPLGAILSGRISGGKRLALLIWVVLLHLHGLICLLSDAHGDGKNDDTHVPRDQRTR